MAKKIPKRVGARTQPLFDPAADVEGLRGAAVELQGPPHVAVEGPNQALQLGWAVNLGQDSEETLSADKVERLREIDESDVQWHLLFPVLLLKLREGRRPCLPLIFQLGKRTVNLGRHVRQVSADGPR